MAVLYAVLQFTYLIVGYFFPQQGHLSDVFAKPGRRTMVIGHRGGNFGPENSLLNFKGAIENNIEGIEFDVSDKDICTVPYRASLLPTVDMAKFRQRPNGASRRCRW